ncbi:MAG: repeat protein [Spirosoma sp.]|nr:repeat protein [Spirosoma sp.]
MTTTFTAYFAQATRRTVSLSPSLLGRHPHSPAGVEWGSSTLNSTRSGHGRWTLVLLWLLWLGWSTNAIAQARTGVTIAGITSKPGQGFDQLDTPQGVYVDGAGFVYVADQRNNRIMKWPPGVTTATSQGTIVAGGNGYGAELNQFRYPSGVVVDGTGFVYVADQIGNRIMKFPPGASRATSGTIVAGGNGAGSLPNQLDSTVSGVSVDRAGAIYVADYGNNRIQKFAPGSSRGTAGTTVARGAIPFKDRKPNQLSGPSSVFVDGAGVVYVADIFNHRIQKFPPGDTIGLTVAGGHGPGNEPNQLNFPSGVFVDGFGVIYVADTENHRIQKWAREASEGITVAGVGDGTSGSGPYQLREPSGVFVNELGYIYVADAGNHRIQRWAPSGTTAAGNGNGLPGGGDNQLREPTGVFVDGNGYSYVADTDNHRIMKFPPNSSSGTSGTVVAGTGLPGNRDKDNELLEPTGVFVDGAGYSYVADTDNHRIMKFPPGSSSGTSGTVVAGTGLLGNGDNRLGFPSDVFVDRAGVIYVADTDNHRIMKFPPNSSSGTAGTLVAGTGEVGNGTNRLGFPSDVFVDTVGTVYVADAGNHRIMKFPPNSSSGTAGITVAGTGTPGSGANQLNNPKGVFVDKAGVLYVADAGNHRIMKWPRDASQGITIAGDNGNGPGANQLNGPRSVFVDGAGVIYVADYGNHRIQKFLPVATPPPVAPLEPLTPGTTPAPPLERLTPGVPVAHVGITVAGDNGNGPGANQLNGPRSVFVESGDIYVADTENHRIQKFPPGSSQSTPGTTVAGISDGKSPGKEPNQLNFPSGVFVDRYRNIYVADTRNHRIQKFPSGSSSGTPVAGVTQEASADVKNLDSPGSVFVDEDEAVYVADTRNHRIQKWTRLNQETVAGGTGPFSKVESVNHPSGVFVDADTVYVADTDNHRIMKWTRDASGAHKGIIVAGISDGKFGDKDNELRKPAGVFVDRDRYIYVADTDNHRIMKFPPNSTSGTAGTLVAGVTGTHGNGANQLDSPYGVFVDRTGAIYVADTGNDRIQMFRPVHTGSGGLLGGAAPVPPVPPAPSALQLVAPLYDCPSGAFSFMTQGGNSSATLSAPIEYMAAGITGWTTNPNQFVDFELRQAADAQPITLMVRQLTNNGTYSQDSYLWDIRAICPVNSARARLGATEPGLRVQLSVSPNPVEEEVRVSIQGAQHQTVRLQLTDLTGQVLVDKQVVVEQATHQEWLGLGGAPVGLYLLRVSTAGQSQTLRLLKAD